HHLPSLPSFPTRRSSDLVQYISTTHGATSETDHDFSSYSLHQNDVVTVEVHPDDFFKPRVILRNSAGAALAADDGTARANHNSIDRKSTRLNSSHLGISY